MMKEKTIFRGSVLLFWYNRGVREGLVEGLFRVAVQKLLVQEEIGR
jgi:hypothetical protein